jgi:hypothetical protein
MKGTVITKSAIGSVPFTATFTYADKSTEIVQGVWRGVSILD